MPLKIIFLFTILLQAINSDAQDTLKTNYPNGKLKSLQIKSGGKTIEAWQYLENGELKNRWSISEKTIESFYSLEPDDSLFVVFKSLTPAYTIKQHYGRGPIFMIENYRNGERHGPFLEYYRNGKLKTKGQFSHYKKVGIWKYYDELGNQESTILINGSYNARGISINYTIFPVLTILLLLGICWYLFIDLIGYRKFYLTLSFGTLAFFALLFLFGSQYFFDKIGLPLRNVFPAIISTFIGAMILLSVVNLFLFKKLKVRIWASLLFLISAILMALLLAIAYMMAGLRII